MAIRSLRSILAKDREPVLKVPQKVQDIIPVQRAYEDGIFRVIKGKYSKTWAFSDINYETADESDKERMFYAYSDILNSINSSVTAKITVNNRIRSTADIEEGFLIGNKDDGLDIYRKELNEVIKKAATGTSRAVQEKYLTISVYTGNVKEARKELGSIEKLLRPKFSRLGSNLTALGFSERMKMLSGFFSPGERGKADFDFERLSRAGIDVRDIISPDGARIDDDYMMLGNSYARAFFLKDYGSSKSDNFISKTADTDGDMFFSIDFISIPTDEAIREAERRLDGVEKNITDWQRKQNSNDNWSAVIPYDMEQERNEAREFLNDLASRDQRMFKCVMTGIMLAPTREKLDEDWKRLTDKASAMGCRFGSLKYQQLEGLVTAVPFGHRRIDVFRTLTTEALAVFIPFRVQDITHADGLYYGVNVISGNMIRVNRGEFQNQNLIILGTSGSGKSFYTKLELAQVALKGDADILIIDPEAEYGGITKALKGEVIKISSTSKNHINAMDISPSYGEGEDPIKLKCEFMLSLLEQIMSRDNIGSKEYSIIDRCTKELYKPYANSGYSGEPPTLLEFYESLLKQPEPEARDIALAIELFTKGSLNTFAKPTNVDTESHCICYDIHDLGSSLMGVGMLVVLDSILNRISSNRAKKRSTYIYIDEIYLLFMHEYSTEFLFKMWKRVRKYGAMATGITQNVTDFLNNAKAQELLSNSEFIIMLNQSPNDRDKLASLLDISDTQLSHMSDVPAGHGLMKAAGAFVPFSDEFPKNSKLYALMTTKLSELADIKTS